MAGNSGETRTSYAAMLVLALGAAAGALEQRQLALSALAVAGFLMLISRLRRPRSLQLPGQLSGSSLTPVAQGNAQQPSGGFVWEEVRPPLPSAVVALLQNTKLGYLSTATHDGGATSPHLSLMNFTYIPGDEVIVMTTRRDTQKYNNLLSQPRVALLVHDFPTLREQEAESGHSRTYSITLYGRVGHAEDKEHEDRYRGLHLENNPGSRNFIVGENIAVLVVYVECARLCNSDDKVTTWSAKAQ